ncbi:hypothetical protein MHY85_05185 [Cellulomonas sp. ACRRI]|uniref:hypothetical protein n=1 Tax=Cellulomonas sp. ACRRI TaxID=2918188 RepID=UPI001EF18F5C|nr:hypothetical protein [Cellulomonas sp. ACRRI]MCG7285369.1 hypothetical protein [Cellulomonas sp. ACRRI]
MVLTQALPQSAREYAVAQRRESQAAVAAVLRLWRRMGADFDESFARVLPSLLTVVTTAQGRVAEGAQSYVPDVLEETGQSRAAGAFATVRVDGLLGVAGDGRPVDSLLFGGVTHAKERVAAGATAQQALVAGGQWLSTAVGTLLSDTGRQAESLAIGVRPVGGYVRMLNPPSCSRCVILAGRWYSKSSGFQRHPGCDCRHIPASESVAGELTVSPVDYFDSLSVEQQDATFTKAGADAIRNGADMNQVVNARRGMRQAQVGGRQILITTEGTTKRGAAARALRTETGGRRPRLMPESIAQIATSRDDYLRLLRANGYLT